LIEDRLETARQSLDTFSQNPSELAWLTDYLASQTRSLGCA
jgi:hypothetical protein